MKKGLVLEGGAMRGLYSAGVIDVLLENNIVVDGVIGVSAGAVFGSNYKSRQIGRAIRYNTNYCKDPRYGSIRSLIKTGDYYGEQFCYHELPEKLDVFDSETYQKNPVDFYVTCTDVHTGKPVYQLCNTGDKTDIQWMRASASMPLVSKIVSIGGYDLLDGGISDSIPVDWFQSIGYEKNIVVLTQTEGYRKSRNKLIPLMKVALRNYPELIKTMERRHIVYNQQLDRIQQLEKEGKLFVIRPSKKPEVSRTEKNPEKLWDLYHLGKDDGRKQLSAMKAFLEV